ncbi:MAG: phosphotransferase [Acidobacteriota bacterium]
MLPSRPPSPEDAEEICAAAATAGLRVTHLVAIAPDASTRRFFRAELTNHPTVVACLYPPGEEPRLSHDWEVHQWAWQHRLPVPAPLARTARVTISTDLGSVDLEQALREVGEGVLTPALACLQSFQACSPHGVPNPSFDAALFRRELEGFARFLPPAVALDQLVGTFFDDLARRLVSHPYRLTHRDFHANNLLLHEARVWAVDFQDLRLGPDTYDLVSLLRERAGGEVGVDEALWCAEAVRLLGWPAGWLDRYRECACQRGLKVLGTFLRLGRERHPDYLAHIPAVAAKLVGMLADLQAPGSLIAAVAELATTTGYNLSEEEP